MIKEENLFNFPAHKFSHVLFSILNTKFFRIATGSAAIVFYLTFIDFGNGNTLGICTWRLERSQRRLGGYLMLYSRSVEFLRYLGVRLSTG